MEINKRYEILESLPVYGPMYISVTENNEPFFSEGFPVRFYKSDGTNWVANFKTGWTSLYEVFDFPERDKTVVFAGGIAYIMSPDKEESLLTFGMTINKVIQANNGSLLCADDISIVLLDNQNGELWRSERISWDGLKDLDLNGDVLHGYSYTPVNSIEEWSEFTLNLKSKELTGGSYNISMSENPTIPKVRLDKQNTYESWWHI